MRRYAPPPSVWAGHGNRPCLVCAARTASESDTYCPLPNPTCSPPMRTKLLRKPNLRRWSTAEADDTKPTRATAWPHLGLAPLPNAPPQPTATPSCLPGCVAFCPLSSCQHRTQPCFCLCGRKAPFFSCFHRLAVHYGGARFLVLTHFYADLFA